MAVPMAVLQLLAAAAMLAFGALAMRVALRLPPDAPAAEAWRVAGTGFLVSGVHAMVQNSAAAWAIRVGPESPFFQAYVALVPEANDGRAMVALGTAALLAWCVRRPLGWSVGRLALVYAVLLAVGTAIGALEGPFTPARHFTVVNAIDLPMVMAMLAALVLGIGGTALDRLLWLALAVYAVRSALHVIVIAGVAWFDVPAVWTPPPLLLPALTVLGHGAMAALAARRLHLRARDRAVPSFLDSLLPLRPPAARGQIR